MRCVQRSFMPGSEWLYIKLYGGEKTLDKLLGEEIYNIIRKLYSKGIIKKWFFIRYSDPDYHIRIRLLLKDKELIGKAIEYFHMILSPFIKERLIWKVQIDTYNRELERYGKSFIKYAESIFSVDSDATISCLKVLNQSPNKENLRWLISLKIIDEFLSDFSFNLSKKIIIMEELSDSFKQEFGFNEYNSKQLNHKYRENRKDIESILKSKYNYPEINSMNLIIKKKSIQIRKIAVQLQMELASKQSNITLEVLIKSYIHMTLNRVFRANNRLHELLIYDFLRRYYNSEEAKIKYQPNLIEQVTV